MRVFVYEHITGGGYAEQPLPEALAAEGSAMIAALIADLQAVSGIEIVSTRDVRFGSLSADVRYADVERRSQWAATFERHLRECEAVWLIAPETDGVLQDLAQRAERARCIVLGPNSVAIALTTLKSVTADRLRKATVTVIPTYLYDQPVEPIEGRWITKPDDGCGCIDTRLHANLESAYAWLRHQPHPERYVMQPYVDGNDYSVSVYADGNHAIPISVNRQAIDVYGEYLQFADVAINVQPDIDHRVHDVVQRVYRAIPGLRGYFGIDLILRDDQWCVVEINPRLTTAYVGLSASVGYNIAERVYSSLTRVQANAFNIEALTMGSLR